jgi:hypothetical protein
MKSRSDENTGAARQPAHVDFNRGPEPFDEVCALCGVFSGAHHQQPDPAAASLPCPEPWPDASELSEEEMAELEHISGELSGAST